MNDAQSLSRQINQAASRLDRRKENVKALGLSLGSSVRSGFASPSGLWIAGCVGFLAAEWIHRPRSKSLSASKQEPVSPPEPQQHCSQAAAMSNTELLMKFALDLGTLWAKANSEKAPLRRSR